MTWVGLLVAGAEVTDHMPPKKEVTFTLPESGIECKVQANGLVTVGIGPGGPRHTVFKRKTESHEEAARRKLRQVGEAQATGAAGAIDSDSTHDVDRIQSDLFQPVDVMMADVHTLTDRERRAPDRLPPAESLRDFAATDGRRKRKRPAAPCADALPDEDAPCMKSACVAARAERDQACAERDQKIAELQQLRGQLLELATELAGPDKDQWLMLGGRSFQVALLEILDGVEDDEGSDEEEADGETKATSGQARTGR